MRREAIEDRKAELARLLAGCRPGIAVNAVFEAPGPVVFEHACEICVSGFSEATLRYFHLGPFLLPLFMLVSGFVIPPSLERGGSVLRFWKARFFRLGANPKFSYLLPSRLGKGKYVLDVKVLDRAYNAGRASVPFRVK